MSKTASEELKKKQQVRKRPVYFDELVQMTEKQYKDSYEKFLINKSYFIRIVLSEWERFVDKKAALLEQALNEEDQYLQR